jgi:uncharacterized membrane protein YfcA
VTVLTFTLLVAGGAFVAGRLGSLTGLGGGVLVPLLVLVFQVDLHPVVGASLLAVLATSPGAASSVREGHSNVRLGMFLKVATTLGALAGAGLAGVLRPDVLAVAFGVVLAAYALLWDARTGKEQPGKPDFTLVEEDRAVSPDGNSWR